MKEQKQAERDAKREIKKTKRQAIVVVPGAVLIERERHLPGQDPEVYIVPQDASKEAFWLLRKDADESLLKSWLEQKKWRDHYRSLPIPLFYKPTGETRGMLTLRSRLHVRIFKPDIHLTSEFCLSR